MIPAAGAQPFRPEARRQQVAALLQHTYGWTRAASVVAPPVAEQVAPALTTAAHLYAARQYGAAQRQLSGVASMLQLARRAYPALPEL
jgi:hypothetical protein